MKPLGVPECPRAPRGWYCTRPADHVGPCAAVPRWWNLYAQAVMRGWWSP